MASCGGSSLQMIKRWLIALLIAGLFGGQAFADCVPSPDTPASVIEYFQQFNKPLPERFCVKEHEAPQARQPPQAHEDVPDPPLLEWGHYTQLTPSYAPHPESDKTDMAEPAAQESAHAIVPDAPQATAPTAEVPSPQSPAPSAEVPSPQSPAPSGTPSLASPETSQPGPAQSPNDQSPTIVKDQLVTITSAAIVRDGPSSSAKIIGRAYAGAMARVAATDSGWAQVVDPASGKKGWVEYSLLAPSTATAETDDLPDVAAPDNWPEDQRADRSENRSAASKSKHSAEAKRHRAKHHHGRRRFVFRFAIRGFLR
jgi:hypothetical protein